MIFKPTWHLDKQALKVSTLVSKGVCVTRFLQHESFEQDTEESNDNQGKKYLVYSYITVTLDKLSMDKSVNPFLSWSFSKV